MNLSITYLKWIVMISQITQDNLHEAAVGVDLVSVAPVSPFKAPLFRFSSSETQSVVAGFMPAIFYSVAMIIRFPTIT